MKKYTFDEEFNVKDLSVSLKKISDEITNYVKYKKMENIKVRIEITGSRIDFKVVGG